MLIRPLPLLACALAFLVSSAQASPITYDFSGTLAQPYKGSSLFSGSFSYEHSSPGFSTGTVASGTEGARATLSIGGQTYTFQNLTVNPESGTAHPVDAAPNVWWMFNHNNGSGGDTFDLHANNGIGANPPTAPMAAMTIHLADPTGTAFPASGLTMPSLNLNNFSVRQFSFSASPGTTAMVGTLTSLQVVPEPSTIAMAVLVGLGLVLKRRLPSRHA
jgi:hypothetical protein